MYCSSGGVDDPASFSPSEFDCAVNGGEEMVVGGLPGKKEPGDAPRVDHRFRQIRGGDVELRRSDGTETVRAADETVRRPGRAYHLDWFRVVWKIRPDAVALQQIGTCAQDFLVRKSFTMTGCRPNDPGHERLGLKTDRVKALDTLRPVRIRPDRTIMS